MTRIDSTKVKWRLQIRGSRARVWKNKGLYETRAVARFMASVHRDKGGYLTRVVRHISGKGKAS